MTGGYTRLFGTGNAINFGGGMDFRLNAERSVRLEVRDYYNVTGPRGHSVAVRIGCLVYARLLD